MAINAAEAWVSADGSVVAIKKKNGGYNYYVSGYMRINREELQGNPYILNRITQLNLEIMEAKSVKR